MYSITDLRKDTVIDLDSQPFKVIDYAQKQMGRGGSIVNVKLKNLVTGAVMDRTFKGSDRIPPADLEHRNVQYLYSDGQAAHFMDEKTYEQFELSVDVLGNALKYLVEGSTVTAQLFQGRVINIQLPVKIALKVTEADPAVKGDTVSAVTKNCKVETGANVQVPVFIKSGDRIIVDTRDGSYVERAKT